MLEHKEKRRPRQINFRRKNKNKWQRKLFGLDEGDESDSAADDSGWEDDDEDDSLL